MANKSPPPVPVDVSLVQDGDGFAFQTNSGGFYYTYAKDTPGKSNCTGECAEKWIPLYPSNRDAKELGTAWTFVIRDDGSRQWAYKGQAVYTFGFPFQRELESPSKEDLGTDWHPLKP
jgi:predicted lipoprotein with Yx(FWY)xxD motif